MVIADDMRPLELSIPVLAREEKGERQAGLASGGGRQRKHRFPADSG